MCSYPEKMYTNGVFHFLIKEKYLSENIARVGILDQISRHDGTGKKKNRHVTRITYYKLRNLFILKKVEASIPFQVVSVVRPFNFPAEILTMSEKIRPKVYPY